VVLELPLLARGTTCLKDYLQDGDRQ